MKAIFFYFLIGSLILSSCGNPTRKKESKNEINTNVIPFNVDINKNLNNVRIIPLSNIGKEIEYIPLETTPESLIRKITQIEFSDSFIFISDFYKLLQFDREGKFVRQIGAIGRGPAEYIYVMGFCIDKIGKSIYIKDYGNRLVKEFNFNGQFIRSFNIPFESTQFLKTDSNRFTFVIPNGSTINDSEYRIIITDSLGVPIFKIRNFNRFYNKPGLVASVIPMYYFKNKIHILESRVDTLNTFENAKHMPYAVFNLGKAKMESDIKIPLQEPEKGETTNRIKDKLWIWTLSENNKYLFLKFNLGISDSSKYCTFNKQTGEITFLKINGFKNDLDGGLPFWPKYIYNDTILIDYADAFNLLRAINRRQHPGEKETYNNLSVKIENLVKNITETSNPILIVLN